MKNKKRLKTEVDGIPLYIPVDEQQVEHPSHYAEGRKYEPYKVIYDWDLDFNLGNVVKYISRCGRKAGESKEKDLKKAMEYLKFEIELIIDTEANK